MRFAAGGLRNLLGVLKDALAPQGATTGAKALDALLRYGPDAGFAAYSAVSAPGGFNPMVGAEDFGISLLGSTLGSLGGRAVGGRLSRGITDDVKKAERIAQAQQVGDLLISAPLQIAAPRPFLERAIADAYPRESTQQVQTQAATDREIQEQLMLAMLTAGTTGLGLGSGGFNAGV